MARTIEFSVIWQTYQSIYIYIYIYIYIHARTHTHIFIHMFPHIMMSNHANNAVTERYRISLSPYQNGQTFLTCYCCGLILSHQRFDQGVCWGHALFYYACIIYMQTYFQILCSLCLQVCIRIYVKHLASSSWPKTRASERRFGL